MCGFGAMGNSIFPLHKQRDGHFFSADLHKLIEKGEKLGKKVLSTNFEVNMIFSTITT